MEKLFQLKPATMWKLASFPWVAESQTWSNVFFSADSFKSLRNETKGYSTSYTTSLRSHPKRSQTKNVNEVRFWTCQFSACFLLLSMLFFKLDKELGFGTVILNMLLCCELMLRIFCLGICHVPLVEVQCIVVKPLGWPQEISPVRRLRPSSSGMRPSATYGTHMISRLPKAKLLGLEAWQNHTLGVPK